MGLDERKMVIDHGEDSCGDRDDAQDLCDIYNFDILTRFGITAPGT